MKKIISILLAGAVALGLMGCSGDLHDAEPIDMSKLFLRGNMNSWGATALTAVGDGSYTVTFSASATITEFAIATNDESWTTAYRKTAAGATDSDPCAAFTEAEFGKEVNLYHGGGLSNANIVTEIGTDYIVKVTPDSGFVKVCITKGEAPKEAYVSLNGEMHKAELLKKGSYKVAITSAATTQFAFQICYDGVVYGAATDSIAIDTNTTLTKTAAKVIKATVEAGEPYNILININENGVPVVNVEYASYKAFIIGDFASEFTRMPVLYKGTNIVKYTFTYAADQTAWSGSNGTVNFKIKRVDNWDSDSDVLFENSELVLDADPISSKDGSGNKGNAVLKGLKVGHKYSIVLDGSDSDDVKAFAFEGETPLYIAGDMNGWSHKKMLTDENGAYFKADKAYTDCGFKVLTIGKWDVANTEVFFGATVTETETPCGTSGNGKFSAAADDKLYIYKNTSNVWCAKLVKASK